jgi:hypothetical protein
MQPQQKKALLGNYHTQLIGSIIVCILTFAIILMEIFDIFHPIDIVPINAVIHTARIFFIVISVFIAFFYLWYVIRFERAKALGESRVIPNWVLFLTRWAETLFPARWTLTRGVSTFILYFIGTVIFQLLTPYSQSPDMAWIVGSAFFYASFITFMNWIGWLIGWHNRSGKA